MIMDKKLSLPLLGLLLLIPLSLLTISQPFVTIFVAVSFLLFVIMIVDHKRFAAFAAGSMIMSIFLLPRYSFAGPSLRVEDYIFIFVMLILLFSVFKKSLIVEPKITQYIVFYLIYCFGITFVHSITNQIPLTYFLYFIKELQYFLYFFFFYHLVRKYSVHDQLIKVFKVAAAATVVYGVYQVLFDLRGYYGIGIISETSPSQSGGAFFVITMFYLYLAQTKSKYYFLVLASSLLTFATVSRTSLVALVIVLAIYFILKFFTRERMKHIVIVLGCFSILYVSIGALSNSNMYDKVVNRINKIDQGANSRVVKWDRLLSYQENPIFGKGKGYTQKLTGGFTLSADSQYLRLYLEVGIVGIILWSLLMLYILKRTFLQRKEPEALMVFLMLIGFLIMSVSHEVFAVVIQSSLFWIVTGIMLGKMDKEPAKQSPILPV